MMGKFNLREKKVLAECLIRILIGFENFNFAINEKLQNLKDYWKNN